MADKIKVTATVIPRKIRVKEGKILLEVQVALNPHLPDSKMPPPGIQTEAGDPADWGWNYYREIVHWYNYKAIFKEAIQFNIIVLDKNWIQKDIIELKQAEKIPDPAFANGVSYPNKKHSYSHSDSEKDSEDELPRQLWENMFTEDTIVSGWNIDELPYEIAARINRTEMEEQVRRALDQCIEQLLSPENATHSPADAAIALHLTRLRNSPNVLELVVNDPILTQSSDIHLAPYSRAIANIKRRYTWELAQMRVELSLHEQESRNIDNTREFHKKFSGYSAHPFLLYKTGWLLYYQVEITEKQFKEFKEMADPKWRVFISIDEKDENNYRKPLTERAKAAGNGVYVDDNKGEGKGKPQHDPHDPYYLSFLQEVKFLYPMTAMRIYAGGEKPGDYKVFVASKPNEEAEKANFLKTHQAWGYILQDENVHINAKILDRRQLMDKLDEQYKVIRANNTNSRQDGGMEAQNRNFSASVEKEHTILANNLNEGGGTEYTNNGITIVLEELKEVVTSSVNNTPSPANISRDNKEQQNGLENEALAGTGFIYLHNLTAGYRLDVAGISMLYARAKEYKNMVAGSLCIKEENYYAGCKDTDLCVRFAPPRENKIFYEGWIGVSAQGTNSDKLFIDQELARWNNWSLVCMRMGDGSLFHSSPADNSSRLHIEVVPPDTSMAPQRFGWSYTFAMRPADICGGGPDPVHVLYNENEMKALFDYLTGGSGELTNKAVSEHGNIKDCWTIPILYQRVDSIPGPVVIKGVRLFTKDKPVAKKQSHKKKQAGKEKQEKKDKRKGLERETKEDSQCWIEERTGEDTMTLVIRSYFMDGKLDLDPKRSPATTTRYLGPPHANLDFVIQHGALDNILANIHARSLEESKRNSELDALINEVFELADEKNEENAFLYFKENREINYLYDPLADGLEIQIGNEIQRKHLHWGLFTAPELPGMNYPYLKEKYWKKPLDTQNRNHDYFQLQLKDKPRLVDDPKKYKLEGNDILLQQGCEEDLLVRCLPQAFHNQVELFYPGVARARNTRLKIVHAVEKPCLLNSYYEEDVWCKDKIDRATLRMNRYADRTDVDISIHFEKFPVLTADTYYLFIQYIDLVGDKTTPCGYRLIITEGKMIKSNLLPEDPASELNVDFLNMNYGFNSTIHRMVNFRIEASSRFKKYFTISKNDDKDRFRVHGILRKDFVTQFTINDSTRIPEYNQFVQDNAWHVVPSTKYPDKPVIEKIVPLIDWKETKDDTKTTIERTNRKIRIYLKDWYSSGAGEKLAVFFIKPNDVYSSANTLCLVDPYGSNDKTVSLQSATTQFGLDPISGESGPIYTIGANFFDGLTDADFVKNIPIGELRFPDMPEPVEVYDLRVDAATYDIHFFSINDLLEQQKQAFKQTTDIPKEGIYYIDVAISDGYLHYHYFPFVRFAVARYQENAIRPGPGAMGNSYFYQFSEIVLTDFIQLLPYRKLELYPGEIRFITPAIKRDITGKKHCNMVMLLEETDQREQDVYNITNNVKGEEEEKAKTNERMQLKELREGTTITFDIDASSLKSINILEFENYARWAIDPPLPPETGSRPINTDDPYDPRNNHHNRLIFAYTHQLTTPYV